MVPSVRIRFLTSTPLNIGRGSGTYVGMRVLADALASLGHQVTFQTPRIHLPVYTLERWIFNAGLRRSPEFDVTVGFDMDGYQVADVAALKGVIADEMRFESGFTRLTMQWQARSERLHVRRARRVITTSRYAAERARELYGLAELPAIVPELIDLEAWRRILEANPARSPNFTVLFVGRLYPRKRLDVLLRAAAGLRSRIPNLALRIVGSGPREIAWRRLSRDLGLERTVTWLGDVPRSQLAAEYNRCHLFCLPSQQEGFGIVLLEAMAAGKPIVAARAAAIPEVAPDAELVDAGNPEALAAGIERLYGSADARAGMAASGSRCVQRFAAPRVA
ncbi:MAG TPA: glycosyltransferase family 4 protein, partial [Bryobacteraceae bacterium]|nr:glycosyltransferase family 4 protein [Bryobacteraceae bacterium]